MNKRGLIGKIFAVIGIVLFILLIIAGITAYQAYGLIKLTQAEKINLETNIQELQKGDCSRIPAIETSANKIKAKAESSCKNPIINYAVTKIQQIPVKCADLKSFEEQMQNSLTQIKNACNNNTISS
jgi:hypothetical protein